VSGSAGEPAGSSAADEHLLYEGDAGDVCAGLPEAVRFDLVYLDPPFAVGTVMSTRDKKGEARGRKQKRSGRAAYVDGADVDALIAHLEPRLAAIRDRMTANATLYLHMDYRAVHDAKVASDRVFGRRAFAGDIAWSPGNGSRGARGFSVTHQTILVYGKSDKRKVLCRADHPLLREPYADTSLRMHFTQLDDDGRRYRERTINDKTYRYYADEGRRLGTVWTDTPAMVANTPLRKEGTGYPTQKPERLLERILRASSREGDTVADLMCGSGTTLIVGAQLKRRVVGGDMSPVAIDVARKRLEKAGVDYRFETCAKRRANSSASRMLRSDAAPEPARS
jgi:site-specific DNA-methyltransferase (adenine-specific)